MLIIPNSSQLDSPAFAQFSSAEAGTWFVCFFFPLSGQHGAKLVQEHGMSTQPPCSSSSKPASARLGAQRITWAKKYEEGTDGSNRVRGIGARLRPVGMCLRLLSACTGLAGMCVHALLPLVQCRMR